jgi:fatty-acyl-CoA synthase
MIELDWLKRWALYTPEAIAIKDAESGRSYSYRDLYFASCGLAHYLQERFSIHPGDRVAVLATNELEYVPLFFALQRLGAIMVPLNFRLAPRELTYILSDCEPKLLIHQQAFKEIAANFAESDSSSWSFDGPNGLCDLLQQNKFTEHRFAGEFEKPCLILYTSGTTGRPKGALLTPRLIFWNALNTALSLDIQQKDIHVSFLPFFHTGGWNVLVTPFLHRGATTILLRKFDPEKVIEVSAREKATLLFGVPTTMDMMAQTKIFADADLSNIRYAITGGEPMPIELIRTWQKKGIPIRQGYGMTEFGPNNFSLPDRDSLRKIGSIGFPNFYVQTRIVDENDHDIEGASVGELLLQGPACFPGYWKNPQASAEALKDGWYHTGDLVRRDEEGYYYVVGRKKDMFISGAENVYPVEIELFLRTHPAIREVAVIGVPDAKWGEVGKAFVVPHDGALLTEGELSTFCRGNLASYKIPKYFVMAPSLPKGDSGKVLKRELPRD